MNDYRVISEHRGHLSKAGCNAGKYVNPYKIIESPSCEKIVEMYDKSGKSFIFDHSSLDKVLCCKTSKGNRVTWYVTKTGTTSDGKRELNYVTCRNGNKMVYLHAYLMDHMFNGKGKNSVDHIDQNPLNNMRSNLRIVEQSVQNKNTGKRSRKKNARPLPGGIVQEDIPKYVNYISEPQSNDLGYRDFFRIEGHPKSSKQISSSKSMKLTPRDKLEQIIEILNKLECNTKQKEIQKIQDIKPIGMVSKSYLAGIMDGDGSFVISKNGKSYSLKIEFSQCNEALDEALKEYFPKKYKDKRSDKYLSGACYQYRVCGVKCEQLLTSLFSRSVIKFPQVLLASEYIKTMGRKSSPEQKKYFYDTMRSLNNDKSYKKNYNRINIEYIAGFFDAEGCVHNSEHTHYLQFVQKCDPSVLNHIIKIIGFGRIKKDENFRMRIYKQSEIIEFNKIVGPHLIIKKKQLQTLVDSFN